MDIHTPAIHSAWEPADLSNSGEKVEYDFEEAASALAKADLALSVAQRRDDVRGVELALSGAETEADIDLTIAETEPDSDAALLDRWANQG